MKVVALFSFVAAASAALIGEQCFSNDDCQLGDGYCSPNGNVCKSHKMEGHYCNIVQTCNSAFNCKMNECVPQPDCFRDAGCSAIKVDNPNGIFFVMDFTYEIKATTPYDYFNMVNQVSEHFVGTIDTPTSVLTFQAGYLEKTEMVRHTAFFLSEDAFMKFLSLEDGNGDKYAELLAAKQLTGEIFLIADDLSNEASSSFVTTFSKAGVRVLNMKNADYAFSKNTVVDINGKLQTNGFPPSSPNRTVVVSSSLEPCAEDGSVYTMEQDQLAIVFTKKVMYDQVSFDEYEGYMRDVINTYNNGQMPAHISWMSGTDPTEPFTLYDAIIMNTAQNDADHVPGWANVGQVSAQMHAIMAGKHVTFIGARTPLLEFLYPLAIIPGQAAVVGKLSDPPCTNCADFKFAQFVAGLQANPYVLWN